VGHGEQVNKQLVWQLSRARAAASALAAGVRPDTMDRGMDVRSIRH
jgi:hypothetical protein